MKLHLLQRRIVPFGHVWCPEGGHAQLENLGSEVREYFETGVELAAGDLVVDVGANIGTFALQAAREAPGLSFICVEPIPALFASLEKNFESHPALRNTRRSLWQVALTHEGDIGETELTYFARLPCDSTRYVDEKRRQFEQFFAAKGLAIRRALERWLGAVGRLVGRLLEWTVAGLPKGRIGRMMSDRISGGTRVRCKLATLDHVLDTEQVKEVALLKVDVEGAELDVLRGISPDRACRVRQIVLEGHDENGRLAAITELLESRGFRVTVSTPAIARERGLNNFLLFARSKAALEKPRARSAAA